MRLLSALNYQEIEEYLAYLPGVGKLDIVRNKSSLLDAAAAMEHELILVSRELSGSESLEQVLTILSAEEFRPRRIIFIYGEYDAVCDDFVRQLINLGIYDYFVGDEITSRDIERLVFSPCGKEAAIRYFQSRYDNDSFFSSKTHNAKKGINLRGFEALVGKKNKKNAAFEKLIISIISNHTTGKSHTAWNLGYCLSKRGYATSLLNMDRGYSANLYFDVDDIYYDLLDFTLQNKLHKDILDNCWKKRNLRIITGRLGDEREVNEEDFVKLLYNVRTRSDITIIDTRTGISAITRLSVKNSIYDLLIFDCDVMHFHMNMKMLEELGDDFMAEKTIAVINNTNVKSSSHKFIYNELKRSGIPFRDIVPISSCGFLGCEMMHTGIVPYQAAGKEYKEFARDMDKLLDKLSASRSIFTG